MKIVITFTKRIVEKGQLIATGAEELISEDVASFTFNEGTQKITITHNKEPEETISLQTGDENHMEQWFFADFKVFQIPLKIE